MATITTSTASPVFAYPNQCYVDRYFNTGHLWCMLKNSSGDFALWRSTDNGATWASQIALTRANVQEWSNIFIDNKGFLHWAYRTNESSQDKIFYRRINLNNSTLAWEAELQTDNPANGGTPGSVNTGLTLTVVLYNGPNFLNYRVVIAEGSQSGAKQGCWLTTVKGDTWGTNKVPDWNTAFGGGPHFWYPTTGTGRITPSVTIEHNGDGKSSGQPNLWVTWGRTGMYMVKGAWTGDHWVMPSSQVTIDTGMTAQDSAAGRWDGQGYFVMVTKNRLQTDTVALWLRNRANTQTTKLVSPTHPTGIITACAVNHHFDSYRVYAVGTSTQLVYYVDYIKASGTWTAWGQLSATAALNGINFGVRDSVSSTSIDATYMAQGTGPSTLVFLPQQLSYAPNTPTWFVPDSGSAQDVNASLLLDWNFSDPDPNDTQTAYAVSKQVGAGALSYWRASDNTWQVAEVKNSSTTTAITVPSSWGAGTDANYTFKAKVWDTADQASGYGAGLFIIPSVKVNPTLTAPGASITTNTVTVAWTVSEQTAYRVRLSGDVTYDSGWKSDLVSTSFVPPVTLTNGMNVTATLNTRNNEGLASSDVAQAFTVGFITPGIPTLVVTPLPASGYQQVACTNPSAAGPPATFVAAGTAVTGNNASLFVTLGSLGIVPGDLMVIFASIRSSGVGTVNLPAGWTSLVNFGNTRIIGRYNVAGDVGPTVAFTGGSSGDDTIAQLVVFRGAGFAATPPNATVLNASAQNIAYPSLTVVNDNSVVLVAGWKQDGAWTSVATLAGMTEIGETKSAAGSGSAEVWDYVIQTTHTNITGASFTVTGGTSQISRGITVALDPLPALAYQDLYRRVVGDSSAGVRIATGLSAGVTYNDWTAASGVNYEYQAIGYGTNGTSAPSLWTS